MVVWLKTDLRRYNIKLKHIKLFNALKISMIGDKYLLYRKWSIITYGDIILSNGEQLLKHSKRCFLLDNGFTCDRCISFIIFCLTRDNVLILFFFSYFAPDDGSNALLALLHHQTIFCNAYI